MRDWIFDVEPIPASALPSPPSSTLLLAIAFAYNRLHVWDLPTTISSTLDAPPRMIFESQCESRSLLYHASLFFSSPLNQLLFSASTIFGQVLLWEPLRSPKVTLSLFFLIFVILNHSLRSLQKALVIPAFSSELDSARTGTFFSLSLTIERFDSGQFQKVPQISSSSKPSGAIRPECGMLTSLREPQRSMGRRTFVLIVLSSSSPPVGSGSLLLRGSVCSGLVC